MALTRITDKQVTYKQGDVNSVSRSIGDKLRESVSVKDFGAVGDGVTDDTAAIQAAINASDSIFIPSGDYKITAVLSIPSYKKIYGDGRQLTKIQPSSLDIPVFSGESGAVHVEINSLSIGYSASGLGGSNAIEMNGAFYWYIEDLYITNAHTAIMMQSNSNSVIVSDVVIINSSASGIHVKDSANILLVNSMVLNDDTSRCALGCIRLENFAEGCNFVTLHTYQGKYPLVTEAAINGLGTRPAYNKFHACYFDAASNPALIEEAAELDFTDCWFSNRPGHGAYVKDSTGIKFTGGGAINCGSHGLLVDTGSSHVTISNFSAKGNSTVLADAYDGIAIGAGVSKFVIDNCQATNEGVYFGNQRHGIHVFSGGSNHFSITNNIVTGNGSSGIFDESSGTRKHIAYNPGYETSGAGATVIPNGSSFVDVPHGLDITPQQVECFCQPTSRLGAVGVVDYWIDNITSTTFKINVNANVTGDLYFAWQVRTKGA